MPTTNLEEMIIFLFENKVCFHGIKLIMSILFERFSNVYLYPRELFV